MSIHGWVPERHFLHVWNFLGDIQNGLPGIFADDVREGEDGCTSSPGI